MFHLCVTSDFSFLFLNFRWNEILLYKMWVIFQHFKKNIKYYVFSWNLLREYTIILNGTHTKRNFIVFYSNVARHFPLFSHSMNVGASTAIFYFFQELYEVIQHFCAFIFIEAFSLDTTVKPITDTIYSIYISIFRKIEKYSFVLFFLNTLKEIYLFSRIMLQYLLTICLS